VILENGDGEGLLAYTTISSKIIRDDLFFGNEQKWGDLYKFVYG
jgi:hypothetical protein